MKIGIYLLYFEDAQDWTGLNLVELGPLSAPWPRLCDLAVIPPEEKASMHEKSEKLRALNQFTLVVMVEAHLAVPLGVE